MLKRKHAIDQRISASLWDEYYTLCTLPESDYALIEAKSVRIHAFIAELDVSTQEGWEVLEVTQAALAKLEQKLKLQSQTAFYPISLFKAQQCVKDDSGDELQHESSDEAFVEEKSNDWGFFQALDEGEENAINTQLELNS